MLGRVTYRGTFGIVNYCSIGREGMHFDDQWI